MILYIAEERFDTSSDDSDGENTRNKSGDNIIPILNDEVKVLFDRVALGKASLEGI